MSPTRKRSFLSSWTRCGLIAIGLVGSPCLAVTEDRVVLRDGSELQARVIELTSENLVLEPQGGGRKMIPRRELLRIEFGEQAIPPIKVRVRVFEADDEVRLTLDGSPLATPAELIGGWVDLADKLRDGANLLEAEVENTAGMWAYRWTLEAAGQTKTFACGLTGRSGCRREGGSGTERGSFPAGKVWLYYHRNSGSLRIEVE